MMNNNYSKNINSILCFSSVLLVIVLYIGNVSAQSKYDNYGKIQYAAPIKSLTIFDKPQLFPRDTAYLQAKEEQERKQRDKKNLVVDEDDEVSVVAVDDDDDKHSKAKASNEYQFVGVVNGAKDLKTVQWFARRRKQCRSGVEDDSSARGDADAWSLRMVYIDPISTARDMLLSNKLDVFGEYRPNGRDPETGRVLIKPTYSIRTKSPLNLWNFRPKQFLTDKSGMKTRERRMKAGVYTDGENIYEATYDYRKGKNVMKKVQSESPGLSEYSKSNMSDKQVQDLMSRMSKDQPDIVLERTTADD